jgi:hypothetical protein
VPIYVNEGYDRSKDGKEWKHVEGCSILLERHDQGFAARRLRNVDASKVLYREHKRRRCPVCMPDTDWPETQPHNPSVGRVDA